MIVDAKSPRRRIARGKTLSAWVKEQEVQVENGKIASYKVIVKITFMLDEP